MSHYLEPVIRRIVTECVERSAASLESVPIRRKPIAVANWKMNLSLDNALQYLRDFKGTSKDIDIVVCAPYPFLFPMHQLNASLHKGLSLGAQNMHWNEKGAHTGEVSGAMLRQVGCHYVIVGHSERRAAGETDEQIHQKLVSAMAVDLIPILCVGESADERNSGRTSEVIRRQLAAALYGVDDFSKVIIAYEPVWAIGTGQAATASYAQGVHSGIREMIETLIPASADKVRLLYGGSVTVERAPDYAAMQDIDGVLVGTSSLSVAEFQSILKSFAMKVGGQ